MKINCIIIKRRDGSSEIWRPENKKPLRKEARMLICRYCKDPILGWQNSTQGMHDGCFALYQDEIAEKTGFTRWKKEEEGRRAAIARWEEWKTLYIKEHPDFSGDEEELGLLYDEIAD